MAKGAGVEGPAKCLRCYHFLNVNTEMYLRCNNFLDYQNQHQSKPQPVVGRHERVTNLAGSPSMRWWPQSMRGKPSDAFPSS